MSEIIVGYTGFVGSNICNSQKFDNYYNSKNIISSYGTDPDICVYSGVPAEMFLANSEPNKDLEVIKNAINNIKKINPHKLILISTIAVYNNPINVNEITFIDENKSNAYGKNRRFLEKWVEENITDYLIVRLPAIYGENLKKNFIYDMINVTPSLLKNDKFNELCSKDDYIKDYYENQNNGFYKCTNSLKVRDYFEKIGFSAMNFTDSRSIYQFYNLKFLWKHINFAINNKINLLNLATEPVSANEVYNYIFNKEFNNILSKQPFNYNMKTKYFDGGYIYDKNLELEDIKKFVLEKKKMVKV